MKISKKHIIRSAWLSLAIILAIILTPVYLENGGFYFDDQGLKVEDVRFRTFSKLKFRVYNESERKGDVLLWFRYKQKNECLWVFKVHPETHVDLFAQCPGLKGKDYIINYEWAASNPRLASSAVRLGMTNDFF